jgi:hypothetical protein
LSPQTNLRTDDFGGSAAKRAEVVVRIIRQIRKETSKEFCIGIKMNSVDAALSESLSDVIKQVQLIVDAGIDFIEISGGTYENPPMMQEPTRGTRRRRVRRGPDQRLGVGASEDYGDLNKNRSSEVNVQFRSWRRQDQNVLYRLGTLGMMLKLSNRNAKLRVVEVGTNNLKRALKSKEIEIYRLLLRTLLKISPSSRIIACEIFKWKAIDNGRV